MISAEHWRRYSSLLDEALELDAPARTAWLVDLKQRDAETASAIARLLQREQSQATTAADSLGERAHFDAALHAALIDESPRDAAVAGQSFGPWQVSRKLGSGGMGEVWLAARADALYEGQAAIKLLKTGGDAERLVRRFARERKLLARLAHPHIARLLDAGVAQGQPYLVLEYVLGQPLLAYAETSAPTVESRVRLVLAIADAVGHAHSQLIVHRDLKPSNVLVTEAGLVKLLDFGIAGLIEDESHTEATDEAATALTRLDGRGLTLDYAAPEQITGEGTGVACDVFSLGVMLFELLGGQRPFAGKAAGRVALEHAIVHDEPQRLSRVLATALAAGKPASARPADAHKACGPLEAVIAKALRKQAAARYTSMAAFAADLRRWLEHRPVGAAPDDWRYRWRLWLKRNRVVAALGTAVALSLSLGLTASLWQSHRLQVEGRKTQAVQEFLVSLLEATDISVGSTDSRSLRGVLDAGRTRIETELSAQPDVQAVLYKVLGKGYFAQSEAGIAESLYRKALPLTERFYGRHSLEYADLLIDLGDAIYEFGRYDEACGHYATVEAMQADLPEGGDKLRILVLNNLSACRAQMGDVQGAVPLREEAVALSLKLNGEDSATTSGIVSDYGLALMRAGRLTEAEAQFRRSLKAKLTHQQNINYAISANLLCEVLIAQGRYAESIPFGVEAEQVIRAAGADTLSLAFALRNQARRLHETGDTGQAMPLLQQAITLLESKVGADAPNLLQMQSLMAQMLASAGEPEKALALAAMAEAKLRGRAPLIYGRVLFALGTVQATAGQETEAIATLQKVIADNQAMLGAQHHTIAAAQAWLGVAQAGLGLAEAKQTLVAADRSLVLQLRPEQALRRMVASTLAE